MAQFQYSRKNVNVYKTNFFTSNFKSISCIILSKAKLLAKIIEISIENKRTYWKEKKNHNAFDK